MPSWRLHEKWAARLGIPPQMAREVDHFIDFEGLHDKGRRVRSVSLVPGIDLVVEPGPAHLVRLLKEKYPRDYELALRASVLHHLLDVLEDQIKSVGYEVTERTDPRELIRQAGESLRHRLRVDYSRYFGGPDDAFDLFLKQLSVIEGKLGSSADELVSDIIEEVRAKSHPIGPSAVTRLLMEVTTRGIVIVDGRHLPVQAASQYMLSRLGKGQGVRLSMETRKGSLSAEFEDLDDLYAFLSDALRLVRGE